MCNEMYFFNFMVLKIGHTDSFNRCLLMEHLLLPKFKTLVIKQIENRQLQLPIWKQTQALTKKDYRPIQDTIP